MKKKQKLGIQKIVQITLIFIAFILHPKVISVKKRNSLQFTEEFIQFNKLSLEQNYNKSWQIKYHKPR